MYISMWRQSSVPNEKIVWYKLDYKIKNETTCHKDRQSDPDVTAMQNKDYKQDLHV
jgi:hypothetical protein